MSELLPTSIQFPYLNTLYPYTFVEVDNQCPVKFVAFRPSKKTWEMLYKVSELGYKYQFLSSDKIGIWKCSE